MTKKPENNTTTKTQTSEPGKGPVQKYRDGALTGNIWANESQDNGTFYSFQISRSYKAKDGTWKEVSSFRAGDLPALSRMVEQATTWMEEASA